MALDALDVRLLVFNRTGWRCEVCGGSLTAGQPQLGHRIPQTIANLKKWGPEIIHHPLNLAGTCSLYCNGRVDIRGRPLEVAALVDKIRAAIATEGLTGGCRVR